VVADALPARGLFGALRRRFAPVFHRVLASRPAHLRCSLPHGESVSVAPEWRHITWNPEEYEAFRRAVRPGWTVIDAGANVGAYSMLFALWAGRDGAVYAFEPDPAAYEGLCRHIALNGLKDRVHAFPVALTDGADGRAALARHGFSGLSRLAPRSARTIDVDAVSLDDFCRSRGISPDLIKIDVEGAELAVLRGARKTIGALKPHAQVFVEPHPHVWAEIGCTAADIARECATLGLDAERIDGGRTDVWTVEGVCLRLRRRAL
jgi:FkbM family methyltransferase